jgi:hypothetical protein
MPLLIRDALGRLGLACDFFFVRYILAKCLRGYSFNLMLLGISLSGNLSEPVNNFTLNICYVQYF